MVVIVPGDAVELRQALELALRRARPDLHPPVPQPYSAVVRRVERRCKSAKIRKLRDGRHLTIAVCGVPTFMAMEAAAILAARGVSVDLLEVSTIKPIDGEALAASARKTGKVLTVEEHTICGGLGSAVAETLAQRPRGSCG